MQLKLAHLLLPACAVLYASSVQAQSLAPYYYNPGHPELKEIWVDPSYGNDRNTGATRQTAVKSLATAIGKIPRNAPLTSGFHVKLTKGTFAERFRPHYIQGTAQAPVIFESVDGVGAARIRHYSWIHASSYIYYVGIRIDTPASLMSSVLHVSDSHHILLKNNIFMGYGSDVPREGLKVNQCQHVYVEGNDISKVDHNPIDFVAVQYGHVVDNVLHDSWSYGFYAKGGSAQLRIEGNTFYNHTLGAFAAGFSTGFEFMVSPWIHYEAYDIKFINNYMRDIKGSGISVFGGFNILAAGNTMERVGIDAAPIRLSLGERTCDGDTAQCRALNAAGGWGPTTTSVKGRIPNKNVYIFNNVLYNAPSAVNGTRHLRVDGSVSSQPGTNIPNNAVTDENLRIQGNVLYQQPGTILGVEPTGSGCGPTNPTCNAVQLVKDNKIDVLRPEMVVKNKMLYPKAGGNLFTNGWRPNDYFPDVPLTLTPRAPLGLIMNIVFNDMDKNPRGLVTLPAGAFATGVVGTAVMVPNPPEDLVPIAEPPAESVKPIEDPD